MTTNAATQPDAHAPPSMARWPVELFLALRYLQLWRAIATSLLISTIVVAFVVFGADLVFAITKWSSSPTAEIFKSAARLVIFAAALTASVWGLIRLARGHSAGVIMGIAIFGVAVGVAVLIVVLGVMTGFGHQLRDRILATVNHMEITGPTGMVENTGTLMQVVEKSPHVIAVAPFIQGYVLVEKSEQVVPALIRGVLPERESRISNIPSSIIEGEFNLSGDGVVMGDLLARQLGVMLHDTISVYAPKHYKSFKANREEAELATELEVTGIFRAEVAEYDSQYLYVSLNTARELYMLEPGYVHAVGVKLDDPLEAHAVRQSLRERLPSGSLTRTWMELVNPQLFEALGTEKALMFFILLIITVVAAFGIASTLFTVSIQKTREIGLLQSLGATRRQITSIFIMLGVAVGFFGIALGVGQGLAALHYRNDVLEWLRSLTGLEVFPRTVYNFASLPAEVNVVDILVITVSALVICTLAGVVPAVRSARLNPVEALRYE